MNWRDAGRWRCHDIQWLSLIPGWVQLLRRQGGPSVARLARCRNRGIARERKLARASARRQHDRFRSGVYLGVAAATAGRPADARRLLESSQRFRTTNVGVFAGARAFVGSSGKH